MKNKQSKILQQRRKKLNVMTTYFRRRNILFYIKIILILLLSLSYYIVSMIIKLKNKNNFLNFDSLNKDLETVYSDSFEVFISLMRKLENYENNLINCTTIGEFHPILIQQINIPKFGNLIMQIKTNSDFTKETKEKFNLLYSENACKEIIDYTYEIENCESFWSGVLKKGMEPAITQMGVILGTVLDELQSLNNVNNNITLLNLINQSAFIEYVEFNEYYLFKAFNKTSSLFTLFRNDKIKSNENKLKLILYFYIFIIVILFSLLVYFVHSFNKLFTSFLNFIGILPLKFISEDENFYNEIMKFVNKFF